MSVRDFIKQLQEEDEQVVYSKPPEDPIQVIPPVVVDSKEYIEPIKVIPPKEEPVVIKFKLKTPIEQPKSMVVVIPPKQQESQKEKTPPQSINNENKNTVDIEKLFLESETDLSKKEKWIEYYNKAVSSKKDNYNIRKMKQGRFRVVEEGKGTVKGLPDVDILPDYKTFGKKVGQILTDKWLK